jgi:hypothetical protein
LLTFGGSTREAITGVAFRQDGLLVAVNYAGAVRSWSVAKSSGDWTVGQPTDLPNLGPGVYGISFGPDSKSPLLYFTATGAGLLSK